MKNYVFLLFGKKSIILTQMKLIVIETMYSTVTTENKIINGFHYIFKALLRCLASSSVEHRNQDHVSIPVVFQH